MSRQYIWLKYREITDRFSNWLYYSILNGYGSIDEFAYRTGIPKPTIYGWIYGSYRPSGKNLRRLSDAFSVSTEDLLSIIYD